MLLTWLGFTFHRSPDFAGSGWGGVLAVVGSLLMLYPLLYMVVKRIRPLRKVVTKRVAMGTLLKWHLYAGVAGPILVILHTGHKFESALGIALTGMTLVVVISGFIGRYLMGFIGGELREKRDVLCGLRSEYDRLASAAGTGLGAPAAAAFSFRAKVYSWIFPGADSELSRVVHLAESIADLEYAIASNEKFKKAFSLWLKFHIVISFVLYGLLGLHVWAAVYFGLRWFS